MSETRKPCFVFLLKKHGKKKSTKVEVFPATLWSKTDLERRLDAHKFRLRINGKWAYTHSEKRFFYKYEIRDIMWKQLPF